MESNLQQEATKVSEAQQPSTLKTEPPGMITPSTPPSTDQPLQEWIDIGVDSLAKFTDYLGDLFSKNQKLLLNLVIILSGIVAVYITLAIVDAINHLPLLAPVFELVGLGYTGWFVVRYLLKASTRKELSGEFEALKKQVLGQNSQDS
ncbi:MAG: hypothetical protein F6K10_09100 [Moorea sp. SIO2B7]|nr:hypothetical protein [Moorena sp. SIO2B7]